MRLDILYESYVQACNAHEISSLIFSENKLISSAAVVIDTLRVKLFVFRIIYI